MTLKAYKDNADGYYEVDIPDGQPAPKWTEGFTLTSVQATPDPSIAIAAQEIARLESTVTQRRIRGMTTVAGAKWVDDVEKLIAIERAKL